MPGTKRKVDEDTWMVSQSKKFKSGVSLANVYETTLAHLRVGARNFFNTLMGSSPRSSPASSPRATSPLPSGSSGGGGGSSPPSPGYNVSPGSPLIRDIISDNELRSPGAGTASSVVVVRPATICQECVTRRGMGVGGTEESYGKCSYCDKLVCHLNCCRGCGNEFCGGCSIPKYDDSSADAFECYNCLH